MLAPQAYLRVTSVGVTDPMGYVISVVLVLIAVLCMWLWARATSGKDYNTEQRGGGGLAKRSMKPHEKWIAYGAVALILLLVLAPHISLLLLSFATVWSFSPLPDAYTTTHYTRVFSGFQVEPFAAATNDPLLRDNLSIPRDAFVIGKIARLFPLKGHSDLLSVLKRILPECPQAHVLCVGDGSLRPHLEARVRELDLTNKVTFTGLVPPAEVPRYVGVMDCLAHLSEREGLARALPQALAAGKPVVTYDCDGAREVCLDSKTGFLARPGHESLVAERLLLLAHDPKLRTEFGQRGQSFVRANFDVEQMVDTIYRLYEALTARHTSQRL
jgi:glycosyltransferase involved in cell wall biosynthesis